MRIRSTSILGIWKLRPRKVVVEDWPQRLGNVVQSVNRRGGAGHPHFRPPSARPSSASQRGVWL